MDGFSGPLCDASKCPSAVSCAFQRTGLNALSLDFVFFWLKLKASEGFEATLNWSYLRARVVAQVA